MRDSNGLSRQAPMRRLFVLSLMFVAAILSCGKDVTGPLGAAARYVRGLAFNPVFPAVFQEAGGASSGVVQFSKVHVVLHHTDGTVALDTTIDFPAGADSLTVDLTVKLLDGAPATGEPMTLNLGYLNAAGDTVFKGGPVSLTAAPPSTTGAPSPPVQVPVSYTGPGSTATTVAIAQRAGTTVAGTQFTFLAAAKDQNGVVLPNAPIIWNSLDPAIASVNSPAAGVVTAHDVRGTARIIAQLFSGGADTATLAVTLPPSQLILQSGNAQTGIVGTNLAQPLVVKVAASDGVGVQGTTVNFAVASGGGSVTNTSAVSDANGLAQTTFKLGTGTGSQTVTATALGLANSPITFSATAQAATASKLVITTQPSNGVAGSTLTAVVVTAEDNNGNIATTYTGPVVIAFGNSVTGATLSGTLTVNAVAGVATFPNLAINKNGTGYTLVASSTGLTSATSNAFDIAVGAASKLLFSVQPSGGVVNAAMSPAIVVNAQDSQGNPTPAFTGSVTLSLAVNPTGATLGGTLSVNAVAGVATFPGITVSSTGSGFSLTAASTGLTSATSALFDIGGGSASSIVIASGGGQTGIPGSALASPVVIQVNDAAGAGIAGSTVNFAVATGGGSVTPASGVTNAQGRVQTAWTLGPAVGPQTITATSAGLLGSPLTVGATAAFGAVSQLIITAQPSDAVAGVAIAPAITVTAKDAGNNVVTSFTGNVALAFGANPGTSTLGGATSVAAVAGVATFNNVSLNKVGTGYTLVATSGAISSAASGTFNITAAAASTLAISGGQGQTGNALAALPTPLAVTVTDAFGNAVAGVTVNWAASGGGTMSPVSSVTNATGIATSSWTLGSTLGAQTATATSGTLGGSPATFNATAAIGAMTQLVITAQPSNAIAGVPVSPAITVTAKDAGNNVVTSFVGSVTLAFGANPGAATLSGATATAVAGVATFNSVSLNKVGTGYTLVASSGTFTSAASNTFNIAAAAASSLAITSGQNQSGNTLTPLATPLGVTVTDAFGNPIAGITVNWASSGGATMSPASSVTSSTGVATSSWTLGSTPGAQTATATSGSLAGSPATFNATATLAGFSKTWTGATSTAWAVATNWTPSGVPVAGDSVFIPSGGNQPTISTAITVKHLTVGFGATLTFASSPTLTVTGNFTDNGATAGAGTIDLNGTGNVAGPIAQNVTVSGTYSATSTVTAAGSISVGGSFTFGGHSVNVSGTFATSGTGTITMTNVADVLTVAGDMTFAGGSESGKITAGAITTAGNFTQSTNATAFIAGGTNTVTLQAAAARTVSMPGAPSSGFANLTVSNPAGVTLTSNVLVNGNMLLSAGAVTGSGFTMGIGGTLTDPSTLLAVSNIVFVTGATPVAATTPVINSNVSFQGNPSALAANLTVNGSATVSSSGQLGFGGHTLTVNGNFATTSSGTISMVAALDAIVVNGNVAFGGGNTSGLITNGTLTFSGSFAQTNSSGGAEFSPAGSHTTILSGGSAQSLSFATPDTAANNPCTSNVSCFGALNVSKTGGAVTFATPTHIQGNLTVSAGATGVTQTSGTPGTPSLITVRGNLTTTATTAPMTFTRLATKGTPALGSTTVVDTIIFAGTAAQGIPGGTYNTVFINGTPIVGANFSTTGNLTVFSTGTLTVGGKSIGVAGNLSTQASGSIAMAAGDTIIVGGNASFNGGASTLTGGLLQVAGNFSQGTTANSFAASSPHITRLTGATPQVTFANPTTSNFGTLQLATTGTVNFNTDVTTSSDIWLKTGFTPSVTNSGGTVNAGRAIFDTTGGRWHVANTVMTSGSGGTLPKSVITNLTFTNGVVLLDSLKVTGNVSVAGAGAQLDLNGHYVLVTGTFGTSASGLLRMVHSNDSLVVKGNATFNGGSTAGLLTFGYFEFDGTTFSQGTNAAAFAADAPHQTYFGGTTQQGVTFANPGYTTASHFGNLFLADTATVIGSNIFLNGQLQSGGSAASFRIGSPADHLVTSNGANLRNVVFDNVRWSTIGTNGAGLFPSIHDVTFQNISQTILPQFDYEYSTKTNITLTNFTFLTTPTGGGTYITIVGPDTLTMTGVTPSNNGGFLSMSGGGAVLNWMGPATQLVISQQPTNTTAGFPISPAIVVTAKDASNNVATSFVGSVSLAIGANPGGATLSGPPSVTAVAGVAVFNSMSLNKAGTGYTLVASSSGVTSATTSTFNIAAGSAATLAITGGQSQSGNTLTALATPLAVTVTDPSGNPVSGVTVNWATSGGASMSPVSSVTNASGVATSSWTLGSTPGAQTATATSGSLAGSPATFNATATLTGFSKTWTGATSTAWAVATNWTPSGVPVAGDSVFIPSGGNQPTISAAVTVKHLTVGFSAALTFASSPTLTVTGNLIVNGSTVGAGTVDLNGTGNVLGLIAQNVTVSGTYSATSSVAATASMSVSGSLTLGGHTVSVGTTFATTGTGTVTMTNAADQMFVSGNATFGGGNETGLLTAGTLQLSGNFSQTTSPTAFVATAPHMTTLSGTLAQTINFANPAAASSHFGNLNLSDTATVLASNVYLTGQLQATGTSFHIESAADHLITSNGANLQNVVFDNVRWATIGTAGAGLFPSITNVTFQNISATTLPQFDFEYSTKTNITLPNFTFLTTPTGGGSYISIVGPDTLTMTGVTPSNNGGLVSLTSGGMVLGWTGAATQLVISQQPTNTSAGLPISPAVVVTAKDFANNVVTTYTGSVSLAIGANPGGATLSGPPSVTAVAGVAVFNSMSLNKAGTGYTLVASASGVTSATTSTFNITAGSAATLAISGGQGQTGITSSPLATALAVTVTDAFGNPVTGTTVTWASSGGAIMTPTSSVTNASGVATSSWTLGSTPGAQTATATSGSLTGSPATFNATATLTGFSKTWTGATSTAWAVATNWTPSGVPVAGDSVFIPSGGNQPTISAAVTVKHLTVGSSAALTFASSPTLTVTGNLIVNGSTVGAGTVDLNGTGNVLGLIAQNVTVSGTYSATSSVAATASMSVSGSLTLGGHTVSVGTTFATTGTGTVTMTNAADQMFVAGNATFGGGNETGLLTAGNMSVGGNFAQINGSTSFVGSAGHTTTLNGSVAQTVNFANVFPSAFGAVTFSNTAGVTLQTGVVANGAVTVGSGAVNGGANSFSINGTLTDPGSHLSVSAIAFGGGTPAISATTPSITATGGVTFNAATALAGNLTINGGVNVNSASGTLAPNGHTLTINGSLGTANSGSLVMNAAADVIIVNGSATFAGGPGTMTNGSLQITGNFTQSTTSNAFFATSNHITTFNGTAAQTVSFANVGASAFAAVNFNNAAGFTLATSVVANGSVSIAGASGTVSGAGLGLTLGGVLTDPSGHLQVGGVSFTGNGTAVSATTPTLTVTGGSVTFNGTSTIAADLTINGGVSVNSASGSISANGHTLTINGNFGTANSGAIAMSNASDLIIVNGNVTFAGGAGVLTNGVLQITGNFTQNTATTAFAASSPHITRFTGATPTISFANPTTSNFGTLQLQTSGAVTFATDAATTFDVWLKTGTTTSVTSGTHTVTVGRNLYDTTGGRWQVANTTMSGSATLPRRLTTNLTFNGTGGVLVDSAIVTGNVIVTGASTVLDLNGHFMSLTGSFTTSTGGVIKMTHVTDSMVVIGSATFAGGSTAGKLTNGYLAVAGNFTQGTTAAAFSADAPHETHIFDTTAGPLSHVVSFTNPSLANSHFGELYLADSLTSLLSPIFANGTLETGIIAYHHVISASDELITSLGADVRNLLFDNVRWSLLDGQPVTDMNNVVFNSISNTAATQFNVSRTGAYPMVALTNWQFYTLPLTGLYIAVNDPDGATNGFFDLSMSGTTPGGTSGFTSTSGGATITGWSNTVTWTGSLASTAWNSAGNWSPAVVPTSTSDVIINSGIYQPNTGGAVSMHNLTVNAGATLTIGGTSGANSTVYGDIVVAPGGQVSMPNFNVSIVAFGNVTTDTSGTTGFTNCNGSYVDLQSGSHTITGKFCNVASFGTYTATGPIHIVNSGIWQNGGGGNLVLNGHRLDTDFFTNSGSGVITMTNAADSLYIHGGTANFTGGSETGLMTAGAIIDRGPTFNATGTGFDAIGGNQIFVVDTSIVQNLNWTSAVPGHGFNEVRMKGTQAKTFGSGDQWILGRLVFDISMTSGTVSGSINLHVNSLVDSSTITGGAFNGSTGLHITGNGTFLHDSLRVNNVHFDGGGNFILTSNLTTNYVVVDSGSGLILNGHTVKTQGNNFTTQNGAVIGMTAAADSIDLGGGAAYFNGGASQLTNGGFAFGSLYQGWDGAALVPTAAANSFSPTAGLRAHLATGAGTNIFFQNAGTGSSLSHFWYLQASTSSTANLKSNVFVDSILVGEFSGANLSSDSIAQSKVRTVTTKSIYNSGTFGMTLSGVAIKLVDGQPFGFFNTITFNSVPAGYTGNVFEVARTSGGPYSFNGLNFSSVVSSGLGAGGEYINNTGTQTLNFTSLTGIGPTITLTSGQKTP